MVSAGDVVRCYHSPTDRWTVVETGVEPSDSVESPGVTWVMPSGNTLIERDRDDTTIITNERFVSPCKKKST